MKQKSNKLRKLERQRYSILTDDLEHCYLCKRMPVDIHEIYGGCNRIISMKNGFCIPLCRLHHRMITDGLASDYRLKVLCQQCYEKDHTRDEFMKLIGRNYEL